MANKQEHDAPETVSSAIRTSPQMVGGAAINPSHERDDEAEDGPLINRADRHAFQLHGYQDTGNEEQPRSGWAGPELDNNANILSGLYTADDRRGRRYYLVGTFILTAFILSALLVIAAVKMHKKHDLSIPVEFDVSDLINGHGSSRPHAISSDDFPNSHIGSSAAAAGIGNSTRDQITLDVLPLFRWIYTIPAPNTSLANSNVYAIDEDVSACGANESAPALKYCHMAMLTQLPNGRLASVFQASVEAGEGNSRQKLYWQTSGDEGLTWTCPRAIIPKMTSSAEGGALPVWSPVLHTEGGVVHIFFSVSVEQCRFRAGPLRYSPGGDIMHMSSHDNGTTWGDVKMVCGFSAEGGISKVIANKLATVAALHEGTNATWLLPFWRENDPWDTSPGCNTRRELMGVPAVLRSSDRGDTWAMSDSVSHGGALSYNWMVENTVVHAVGNSTAPGRLDVLQLFRTPRDVPLYASRSSDGGTTWTTAAATQLPNPDSKVHVAALPSGNLLLAFNDSPRMRTPLTPAMSRDGGVSWVRVAVVEDDRCSQFSYPTIQVPPTGELRDPKLPTDQRVYVAYTVLRTPDAALGISSCKMVPGSSTTDTKRSMEASGMRIYITTVDILEESFVAASSAP